MTFQSSVERRRCQFLFYGVLRHRRRIETLLTGLIPRRPKPRLWAMLEIAVYELMEAGPERQPKVVDYAVGEIRKAMGKGEAGLANAVLRKIPKADAELEKTASAGVRTSHPDWLAKKWEGRFGPEAAEQLMRWNLQTPEVCLRVRDEAGVELAQAQAMAAGEGELFEPTPWPGFVSLAGEFSRAEPLLKNGALYAQDASTRLAPEALAVKPGDYVLDLCAAPGGKTLMLADSLGTDTSGLLLAVELPGSRLEQLDENLQKLNDGDGPAVSLLATDVLTLTSEHFAEQGLPDKYDAVLLDAP
ncbi:MAG: transcription antitermination factor NusB, partial [Verrucomicrobiota bacterium]